MALTWHQETMGVCPHGLAARPYCALCVMEDKAAEAAEKAGRRDVEERKRLERTVAEQSAALDAAYGYIEKLKRRRRG